MLSADEHRDEAVMTLVASALRLPEDQRELFVEAHCDDAALREEVKLRIQWEVRMGEFLRVPVVIEPEKPLESGEVIAGRFRLLRRIGAGGMGVVFEAHDEMLDRRVALKCARASHSKSLPPEARAAREISHYNVCKVHDVHVVSTPEGDMEFLSMEYIEGETLSERIRRDGPAPAAEARDIALQLCAGLAQAHRQGVIHGDLKCSNIMLARAPQGGLRVVITDFGLAKMAESDGSTVTSTRGGTLDYMAPELLLGGRATIPSDIYALGVLFHIVLTGLAPSRLTSVSQKTTQVLAPVPDAHSRASTITPGVPIIAEDWRRKTADLPSPWNRVVRLCLEPLPPNRMRSVEQIGQVFAPKRIGLRMATAALALALPLLAYWEWNAAQPPAGPPVRLAVLPFSVEGNAIQSAAGLGVDIAERLSGARKNFTVLSPADTQANRVDTPEKARSVLGATHVLRARMHESGGSTSVSASLLDLASGREIAQLNETYAASETPAIAKAILATATGAFHLSAAPKESVSGAAYAPYVEGIELLRRDNIANAGTCIPYFENAIRLDPNSALPYAGLAEAQIQRFLRSDGPQWLDLASASIDRAKKINPDSVPVLLADGYVAQQHGHYEEAIREFLRATELAPADPATWRRLAACYERANRPQDAVATYLKAIAQQPDSYREHLTLGTFYLNRAEYQGAEKEYRHVTQLAPELFAGHMNLGLAYLQEGRFQDAEKELLGARRLHESKALLLNIGAMYYAEERFEEAASFFEKSMEGAPPSALLLRNLGDANRHLGRRAAATGFYRRGLSVAEADVMRNPRDAAAHSLLGLLAAFTGDFHRAEFEISQALSTDRASRTVIRNSVLTYEMIGQRASALNILRKAPATIIQELSRQPDLKQLRAAPEFQRLITGR